MAPILLTTKNYRSHVNAAVHPLPGRACNSNKYCNLKIRACPLQDSQHSILTSKLKSEAKEEWPLGFHLLKWRRKAWRVERISRLAAA